MRETEPCAKVRGAWEERRKVIIAMGGKKKGYHCKESAHDRETLLRRKEAVMVESQAFEKELPPRVVCHIGKRLSWLQNSVRRPPT